MNQKADHTKPASCDTFRSRSSGWRTVGLLGFLAVWVWATKGRAGFSAFVDLSGLAIVGTCTVALLLVVFGGGGARRALGTLLRGSTSPPAEVDAIFFFRQAAVFALGSGLLATLVGLVVMLQNMSDPSMIGPAISAALLPQLYAGVVALLSLVAAAMITRRGTPDERMALSDRLGRHSVQVAGIAAGAGVVTILLVVFTNLLSMSEIKRDPRFERVMADLRADFSEAPPLIVGD